MGSQNYELLSLTISDWCDPKGNLLTQYCFTAVDIFMEQLHTTIKWMFLQFNLEKMDNKTTKIVEQGYILNIWDVNKFTVCLTRKNNQLTPHLDLSLP